MEHKAAYGIEIKNMKRCIKRTISVYNDAVNYLVDIALIHYDELSLVDNMERNIYFEKFIHTTKKNKALYKSFDKKFYKMPSYFRRAALREAYGEVDSWKKLIVLWEENGCKGKRPRLQRNRDRCPCFYHDNMYKNNEDSVSIKLFSNNDWVWVPLNLKKTDIDYFRKLREKYEVGKISAPTIIKRNKHYELQFFTTVSVPDAPLFLPDIFISKAVGVDLGINTDAVCTVLNIDGTVNGCKFIDHPLEKDRLYKNLNVIKKSQQHGNFHNPRLWSYVNNYNNAAATDTAVQIVDFAVQNHAQIIVFEHLNISGKIRGSKKQRIALWKKRTVQKITERIAARYGIRVTYICPKNTSKLAFDGSGEVTRGSDAGFKNNKLCRFKNGKVYNCDLSASKNIAARYFIRSIKKEFIEFSMNQLKGKRMKKADKKSAVEKLWLQVEAKVPHLCKRTETTLSTLIGLNAVLAGSPVSC